MLLDLLVEPLEKLSIANNDEISNLQAQDSYRPSASHSDRTTMNSRKEHYDRDVIFFKIAGFVVEPQIMSSL